MGDISKLPKWAQEHIETLQRERDEAVRSLISHSDSQIATNYSTRDHVSLGVIKGPSCITRYFDAPHGIAVRVADMVCEVQAYPEGGAGKGNRPYIGVRWGGPSLATRELAFIPQYFQGAIIVDPRDMRLT